MKKIVRITTVPESLKILLKGQLGFISQYFKVIGVSSEGKDLYDVANEEGIDVFSVNMTRRITPLMDLISLVKLLYLFIKLRPAIVHTHTPKAGLIGMLASWLLRIPHRLHTVAGLPLMETTGIKKKFLILIERITYKCSTKIYPNSYGLQNFIIENIYSNSNKIKVLANGSSNGINLDYFKRELIPVDILNKLREQLELADSDFIFIFIGRIVSNKGINELITAFINVSAKNVSMKLLLVGKYESDLDPLNPDIKSNIINNPNIFHIDFVNDVRPYLALSSCLVFPSYREGFPNVVMQAAAMELPCIVSNINGCNEIIQDGENGLIVEVKNVLALENAMKKMHKDATFYSKLRSNARKSIANKFDRHLVWNAILDEYKKMAKE